jgi:hypothetical protein
MPGGLGFFHSLVSAPTSLVAHAGVFGSRGKLSRRIGSCQAEVTSSMRRPS